MHALSVRQPWAEAIARFGKDVENRSRRPPAHLLGQRIAIHVSRTGESYLELVKFAAYFPPALSEWMRASLQVDAAPPHAGRIVATARLTGWVDDRTVERAELDIDRGPGVRFDRERIMLSPAWDSPWRIDGQCGWLLADVRALRVSVGNDSLAGLPCLHSPWGRSVRHAARSDGLCECCGHPMTGPIRGQLGCWRLSPEVEAAVLAQEVSP